MKQHQRINVLWTTKCLSPRKRKNKIQRIRYSNVTLKTDCCFLSECMHQQDRFKQAIVYQGASHSRSIGFLTSFKLWKRCKAMHYQKWAIYLLASPVVSLAHSMCPYYFTSLCTELVPLTFLH